MHNLSEGGGGGTKTNNLIRERFLTAIGGAIKEADDAGKVDHSGLAGQFREIVLSKMLVPILPPEVKCGTGKLTDMNGKLTKQIDIILYSKQILPPSLYDEKNGIFPVESCLYSIEVKSTVTSQELKLAIENARSIRKLSLLPTTHLVAGDEITKPTVFPITALFGFSSDLSGNGKNDLDRYREWDEKADEDPAIGVICIRGKGYWYFSGRKSKQWKYFPSTSDFEEVLCFFGGLTNTIPQILSRKGRPKFGHYLLLDGDFENV